LSLSPSGRDLYFEVVRQGLHDLGYVEGQNIFIVYKSAEGRVERLPDLAAELVRMKVDVIMARATPVVQAAKNATSTIPIVASAADVVGSGFVASLARPGGNITGTTSIMPELAGKRLELLREIVPKLSRVAFLAHGGVPAHRLFIKEVQAAGESVGVQIQPLVVKGPEEFEGAFSAMAKERAGALIVQPLFSNTLEQGQRIADLAARRRLPTISDPRVFAEAGGLMSYGTDSSAMWRRVPFYVDKILKGAKPADLPVEQPMKFEFVINLKTAKQIGLTIPQSVLFRADKVIK
jgi:putative ABC transport system substrate-binding protein